MNTTQVNYVNIGLMIVSAIVAFIIPFELFLFSYAFLGPLHYLTEISWLHKRKYFSPGKRDYLILIILTILILLPSIFVYIYGMIGVKDDQGNPVYTEGMQNFFGTLDTWGTSLMFFAFASAAIFVLIKGTSRRIIGFVIAGIIAIILNPGRDVPLTEQEFKYTGLLIFSVFLPTLIHVFVFTGVFILVGALKAKSTSGYLSIFVFLGCAVSFFFLFPDGAGYKISSYAKESYDVSFYSLNRTIFETFLHTPSPNADNVYYSSIGILVTRFIAYAYTYHYLNWFSKTSIIKWHEVSRGTLIAIFALWILALVLYQSDYKTGLDALLFLSFLHVVLEFPLNFQSFKQMGQEIGGRLSSAKT
ncbi:MAG: hypothetical protein H7Y00_06650 [Fimbriimonadaceae bacterium]|nr:hypothetical protein [Chitinophagales bacterium]